MLISIVSFSTGFLSLLLAGFLAIKGWGIQNKPNANSLRSQDSVTEHTARRIRDEYMDRLWRENQWLRSLPTPLESWQRLQNPSQSNLPVKICPDPADSDKKSTYDKVTERRAAHLPNLQIVNGLKPRLASKSLAGRDLYNLTLSECDFLLRNDVITFSEYCRYVEYHIKRTRTYLDATSYK